MRSVAGLLITLTISPSARGEDTAVLGVVHDTPAVRVTLERALCRALGRVLGPTLCLAQARRRLRMKAELAEQRGLVLAALEQARSHRRHVRYEEALKAATLAARHADTGLLELYDPLLLAEVELERGLALLPTDPEQAERHLVNSFVLRGSEPSPASSPADSGLSPKITAVLQRAAERAREHPAGWQPPSEAAVRRAAGLLSTRRLALLVASRAPGGERLRVVLFDTAGPRDEVRREIVVTAPVAAPSGSVAATLERALRARLGLPEAVVIKQTAPPPARPGRERRLWPWVVAAGSVAAVATGVALVLVSNSRLSDAEALARRAPLEEYATEAEGLESTARRYRGAGIASLALAGAAAVVATAGFLWPTESRAPRSQTVSLGPCGLLVRFH